jgi:hypothetical protein
MWAPWPRSADYDEYDFLAEEEFPDADAERGRPATTNPDANVAPDTSSPLYVGGFGSYHGDGAHFAFGDGRVVCLTQDTDSKLLRQMGHRGDGQPLVTWERNKDGHRAP